MRDSIALVGVAAIAPGMAPGGLRASPWLRAQAEEVVREAPGVMLYFAFSAARPSLIRTR